MYCLHLKYFKTNNKRRNCNNSIAYFYVPIVPYKFAVSTTIDSMNFRENPQPNNNYYITEVFRGIF